MAAEDTGRRTAGQENLQCLADCLDKYRKSRELEHSLANPAFTSVYSHLDACVAAQVEVELGRVRDAHVDCCASRYVATLAYLVLLVGAEEASVVTLLNDDERDTGLVSHLQFHTRLADSLQLHG